MSRQTLALIATILGALVLVLSALADWIGLGTYPGLGWRQRIGLVIGVVGLYLGVRWRRKAKSG